MSQASSHSMDTFKFFCSTSCKVGNTEAIREELSTKERSLIYLMEEQSFSTGISMSNAKMTRIIQEGQCLQLFLGQVEALILSIWLSYLKQLPAQHGYEMVCINYRGYGVPIKVMRNYIVLHLFNAQTLKISHGADTQDLKEAIEHIDRKF